MPGSTSGNDGFVMLPKFILNHTNLNPDAIVLYCNLLHFDRGAGKLGCVAKRSTLANICGFSIHRVRRAVKLLEDEGIISVIRRRNSLTDRIRITPDCRPPTKSTKSKPKSTTNIYPQPKVHDSNRREKVRESSNLNELPNIKTSTLKDNNTKQENNNGPNPINSLNSTAKPKDSSILTSLSPIESIVTTPPMLEHLHHTERLKSRIRHQIRDAAYNIYFDDISVVAETDNSVSLTTPQGEIVAKFIQSHYSGRISEILGKDVKVIPS